MHLYPIDDAAARVPQDATPFAYRNGGWAGVIVGVDPDPANAELITGWATSYWEELHPTSAGGAYVNFMMAEGEDRIRASYRGNYDRLAVIRRCTTRKTCSTSTRTFHRHGSGIRPRRRTSMNFVLGRRSACGLRPRRTSQRGPLSWARPLSGRSNRA